MDTSRRDFIRKTALGTAGLTVGGLATGMSAKSHAKIIGANERLNLAIIGLGRRLGAYYDPISRKDSNVELVYLCDVMKKQREDGAQKFSRYISCKPKLENDVRKIIADKQVDALFSSGQPSSRLILSTRSTMKPSERLTKRWLSMSPAGVRCPSPQKRPFPTYNPWPEQPEHKQLSFIADSTNHQ